MHKFTAALLTILLSVGLMPSLSTAQDSDQSGSVRISVSANVVESIEMTTVRNMQVEPVQPSQQQININPLTDSQSGKMIALGNPNASIRVTFVRERTLTHASGTGNLDFTYEIAGNDQDDQSSAEILQTDNRNLTLNAEGRYYFWIGGQVNIQNAKPGNYAGDFTIEVEYI